MNTIKILLVMLCCIFVSVQAKERKVIALNELYDDASAKMLWPSFAASFVIRQHGETAVPVKGGITVLDLEHNKEVKTIKFMEVERNQFMPLSVVGDAQLIWAAVLDRNDGRMKLIKYSQLKNSIQIMCEHHGSGIGYKVHQFGAGNTLLVSGSFMSGYTEMLDRSDENTLSPSVESINNIKAYFKDNNAYNLSYYDTSLTIIDSADFIDRRADDLQYYLNLLDFQPADVDDRGHVFISNQSSGFDIHEYDTNRDFIRKIKINDPDYHRIPADLSEQKYIELKRKANSYSQVYALYVSGNKLISSYYHNPGGYETPKAPYFYCVLSMNGELMHLGEISYPIFCKDDEGGLYVYVNRDSGSLFGGEEYYLVEVSIQEIQENKITPAFIDKCLSQDR